MKAASQVDILLKLFSCSGDICHHDNSISLHPAITDSFLKPMQILQILMHCEKISTRLQMLFWSSGTGSQHHEHKWLEWQEHFSLLNQIHLIEFLSTALTALTVLELSAKCKPGRCHNVQHQRKNLAEYFCIKFAQLLTASCFLLRFYQSCFMTDKSGRWYNFISRILEI